MIRLSAQAMSTNEPEATGERGVIDFHRLCWPPMTAKLAKPLTRPPRAASSA
jgi:hypothetical protein